MPVKPTDLQRPSPYACLKQLPRGLPGIFAAISRDGATATVGLLAILVPLLPAPIDDLRWHGLKSVVIEAVAFVFLAFPLLRRRMSPERSGPTSARIPLPCRWLLGLLAWETLSLLLTAGAAVALPYGSAAGSLPDWAFAVQGVLGLGAGALIAGTVAAGTGERQGCQLVLDALTAATLVLGITGLAVRTTGSASMAVGFFHDHQLFGAPLVALLPVMLAAGLSPVAPARRLAARAAFLIGLIALGVSETRASWIGAAAALVVFCGLMLFAESSAPAPANGVGGRDGRRRRLRAACVLGAAACAVGFLAFAPQMTPVRERLGTLPTTVAEGKEWSVKWRLAVWQGAERMIGQKPVLGWGIGSYPAAQHEFTDEGGDAARIRAQGPTIEDEAHNSYLQTAVETGLTGLVLWLGVIVSAFWQGAAALRRLVPGGLRQRALAGGLAALAGQAVDAVANPAWQFGGVALFLWIALGLTVGLTQGASKSRGDGALSGPQGGRTSPALSRLWQGILAAGITAGLLWLIWLTMPALPSPKLE